MRGLVLALVLIAGAARAQELPAFYTVTGVASDDVLNVRMTPSGSGALLATLDPGAVAIEVVGFSEDRRWAQVNAGEMSGWVAARYLAREPDQDWDLLPADRLAPRVLSCFGVEPFWQMNFARGPGVEWLEAGEASIDGSYEVVASYNPMMRAFVARWDGAEVTGILRHESCSDGMSEMAFGLSFQAVRDRGGARDLINGCCALVAWGG